MEILLARNDIRLNYGSNRPFTRFLKFQKDVPEQALTLFLQQDTIIIGEEELLAVPFNNPNFLDLVFHPNMQFEVRYLI